jgi:hypothetical protein
VTGGAGATAGGALGGARSLGLSGSGGSGWALGGFVYRTNDRADIDLVSLSGHALECAVGGSGDLHGDLVGLEFEHGLVALDVVSVALEPRGDHT